MHAAARDPDDKVARRHIATGDDAIQRHEAHRGPGQIEAADDILELRGFAARYRDARFLGAAREPCADRVEHLRIRAIDRDVIDEGHRLGAQTDKIVDIHGDAIDADRVVFPHHLRDDGLCPDAVGADREPPAAADIDHIREVADRQLDPAECRGRQPIAPDSIDEIGEAALGFVGIDPGGEIGGARRRIVGCHWRRSRCEVPAPTDAEKRRLGRSAPFETALRASSG